LFSRSVSLKKANFSSSRLICFYLPEISTFLYIPHMSRRTYQVLICRNLPLSNLIFTESPGLQFQNLNCLLQSNIRKTSNDSLQIRGKNRSLTQLSSPLTNNICDVHSYTNDVT
jgi:hypothetical protein